MGVLGCCSPTLGSHGRPCHVPDSSAAAPPHRDQWRAPPCLRSPGNWGTARGLRPGLGRCPWETLASGWPVRLCSPRDHRPFRGLSATGGVPVTQGSAMSSRDPRRGWSLPTPAVPLSVPPLCPAPCLGADYSSEPPSRHITCTPGLTPRCLHEALAWRPRIALRAEGWMGRGCVASLRDWAGSESCLLTIGGSQAGSGATCSNTQEGWFVLPLSPCLAPFCWA